ncbi:2-oxo-tetronate isomerase [Brucella gallinifaecis]|uniref:Hydroxypyruvate isomerase family protein n=1 Tax=Brucella gallinifaecis TaxID=215590 RepID=A0A502BKX2_9HYPH|nr:2-oxo-tetronate isomerase [Brucella gallinifaecis]TPF74477.1 hydroxypyruvate isomerase family protein [Brucella gallinifaecis]
MPNFAANLTMMFNELPFLDRFDAAAKAGFKAVEFLFPYEHDAETVREKAMAAGVEIALFNMPPGDWESGERGIAAFPDRAQEFSNNLVTALHYAQVLRVPRIHMMAGLADSNNQTAQERYLAALCEAADAAQPYAIDILLEPINKRDMPGYFLNDFNQAVALIEKTARSNVKLQYDIYHRQILHGDVTRSLETLLPLIGHIQTASVPLRHEPGSGELNDTAIFKLLDRLGYSGFIGCEYRPQKGTLEGLEWLKPYL